MHGAAHRAHIPDAQGLPWWSLGVAQRVGHPATTIVVVTVVMVFVAVATTDALALVGCSDRVEPTMAPLVPDGGP